MFNIFKENHGIFIVTFIKQALFKQSEFNGIGTSTGFFFYIHKTIFF